MNKPAWKIAEEERIVAKFSTDAYVDSRGVVRWKSNDRVPPKDVLELWIENSKVFNYMASQEASAQETAQFIAEYRKAQKQRTPEQIAEERFEALAAHGPRVTLVNIITGERYTT